MGTGRLLSLVVRVLPVGVLAVLVVLAVSPLCVRIVLGGCLVVLC
ncbi:hypothetical protein [Streptomyces oceani]|nr:hypothetical protein [Streptomyces oceani]